ncbi:MAG: hypothetical protein NTY94_18270 [Alphaproteobacteria bacterium]|nr:hypothetical protein [Alphaproteobacteria bacterium]
MSTAAPATPAEPTAREDSVLTVEELARTLDAILASLLALLRTFARYTSALGPLATPIWNRISRTRVRLARAMAHLANGHTPRPARPRTPRPHQAAREKDPRSHVPVRRHAWLGALLDHHVRAYASQFEFLLARPGAAALIAASPGATRTLRPLCRMLGTELPAALRLPPRPRPARPKPAKPPRAKGPSPGLAPGDQPFRPYVLKAIRYAKRHGLWRPWEPD